MDACRVLDISGGSSAYCSRLLGDLGWEVTKIEQPGGGRDPEKGLPFLHLDQGKRRVTLDIETEAGRTSFLGLALEADVMVESFPPGYLSSIGIGYPELSALNPGLTMVSITGFGQSGPYSSYAWSDIVVQALGGWMYTCGNSGYPPLMLPHGQATLLASVFGAAGALLALQHRRRTGLGQQVDISVQECVAASLDHVLPRYFGRGEVSTRQGSLHWNNAFRIFTCRDGHLLATLTRGWDTLVQWMESQGMGGDLSSPEWQDEDARRRGIGHIIEVMERWTAGHEAGCLEDTAQLMGLPWARVAGPPSVVASPQLRARGFFAEKSQRGTRGLFNLMPWKTVETPAVPHVSEGHCGEGPASVTPAAGRVPRPLEGVRVLDFTRVLAGPYATRVLADFGAEVVRVQMPGEEETDPFGRAYHEYWNRNKLGISIDLSRPGAIGLVKQLVAKSDVIVENFSPRVMANWGLDYENIKLVNPGVIMVSLSARGHTGPQRDYVGYGPTVHALSGLSYLTAYSDRTPIGPGHAYADHVAGMFGALAVLAALDQRQKTGAGRHVDISETEALCSMLGVPLLAQLVNGFAPPPSGNASAEAAPHGCYRCRGIDQWCAIAVEREEQWEALVRVMKYPSWAALPAFSTKEGRLHHRSELDRLLETWTADHTAEEVMGLLQSAGVPAGKVLSAAELAADPHLNAGGFFINPGVPGMPGLRVDSSAIRMSLSAAGYARNAPGADQDAVYVLEHFLGLGRAEITMLAACGVIRER